MFCADKPRAGDGCLTAHLLGLVIGLWCVFASGLAAAQDPEGASHDGFLNCAPDGIGVGGYDLVSYHQEDGPLRGIEEYAVEHGEVLYLFVNAANRDAFLADPESYLPVYTGYCAATLAMGRLACPDYTNFRIEDGRLLLFELAGFTNGRTLWESDAAGFRARADQNFQRLLARPTPE